MCKFMRGCVVGEKKDWTKRDFRSKTTLITGGVCGNSPCCEIVTFFHRSLALSMPIYRNFQSNGVKWRSINLWKSKFHITGHWINFRFQSLRLCHLTPFDWKFLYIGILRAKDLWINVAILQTGEFTHVPHTPPVIRVVLLHTEVAD